jgi:hypothetical protein
MWWKILIGFFVLRSVSQPQAAPAAQARPSGVMPMTMQSPITSPMMQQPAFGFTNSGPVITTPMFKPIDSSYHITSQGPVITTPMFDNTGPQKIMQPAPAFGGSQGFQF